MKGKVKVLALSHKNGRTILRSGDEVKDVDVLDFGKLVEEGKIESTEYKKSKAAAEKKAAEKKATENK